MKILVFGGTGKIGKAITYDLSKNKEVSRVGIADINQEALKSVEKWLNNEEISTHILDANNTKDVSTLMAQYDVGVIALPNRKTSYKIVETAITQGLNCVDILEEYHRRPEMNEAEGMEIPKGMNAPQYGDWLHQTAVKNNITLLDGFGFAPGLSNITIGEGIRRMDRAISAIARVGGIPTKEAAANHPLRYMITWSFEHVLREYMVNLEVIKNGKRVETEAMSEHETFLFSEAGQNEELECFITPGMPSFPFTRPQLQEFAEKTIRWPGHYQGILTLKESGLLDLDPVNYKGTEIVPRDFMLSMLEPRLKPNPGETDICVMYNTIEGERNGKNVKEEYFMWAGYDTESGLSAMAKVTGFTAAIGAVMLGKGQITAKGIVAPEDAITSENYDLFLGELKKRGIEIIRK